MSHPYHRVNLRSDPERSHGSPLALDGDGERQTGPGLRAASRVQARWREYALTTAYRSYVAQPPRAVERPVRVHLNGSAENLATGQEYELPLADASSGTRPVSAAVLAAAALSYVLSWTQPAHGLVARPRADAPPPSRSDCSSAASDTVHGPPVQSLSNPARATPHAGSVPGGRRPIEVAAFHTNITFAAHSNAQSTHTNVWNNHSNILVPHTNVWNNHSNVPYTAPHTNIVPGDFIF